MEADEIVYQRTIRPEDAPDQATVIAMDFAHGDPVAIDGVTLSPAAVLTRLNELGKVNGIGRLDMVENRFVGMKSRGVYETPGRDDPAGGASRDREHHAGSRGGASEGQPDAALRGADLQRVLVQPGAADAAGADRQEPAQRDAGGCG